MGKKYLTFSLIFFLLSHILISQTNREAMDKELREELGIEKKNNNSKENSTEEKNSSDSKSESLDPIREEYESKSSSEPLTELLLKLVLTLGILAFVLFFILRFLTNSKYSRIPIKDGISILSVQSLGGNKSIQLVEAAGEVFLVGVTEANISLIKEITSIDIKSKLLQEKENFTPSTDSFWVSMLSSLKNINMKKNIFELKVDSATFNRELIKKQKEKLEKIKKETGQLENEEV